MIGVGGPTRRKKRREQKRRPPRRTDLIDERSYPETTLSPWTYEGRVEAFGNVLRAARYGSGRRALAGRVILTITAGSIAMLAIASLIARL